MQAFPRPNPYPNQDGPSYEMDPSNAYQGGGGGRSGMHRNNLGDLTQMPGIAVGEPNPSAPGGMHGSMQAPGHMGGMFAGYTGPRPGSPEWQAARAQGQHPLMDWFHTQHPNWQGFNAPQRPPMFGGGMNAGPEPRPMGQPMFPQPRNPWG